MDLMKNKVALVTGAASGIGRESALTLAREGASVCVSDINTEGGEETAQMIIDNGGKAIFVDCNVTNADDVNTMVKTTVETFGRLDTAVNNAGISGSLVKRIHEVDDEQFDRIMSINVKGVWLCMKAELPYMLEQGKGSIVNIASVAGLIGAPKGAAYAASKHAVVGLTKSAAVEYAKLGLRVNAVCPAYTETPMVTAVTDGNPTMQQITVRAIPMRRLGQPTEIAEGVLWLCSDASSFVTGHQLVLDGGLTAI
jgi:NAD(P)-dependent dehydrogenase (short-subunit alcohol dehydrogenase family)